MANNGRYMNVQQPHDNRTDRTVPEAALTSVNDVLAARATSGIYTDTMRIAERDREIVQLVARFKQLTTTQIKELVYPGQLHDPQRRAIKRLLENKMLARVNERLPGGFRGGSQEYVYQLGTLGVELTGTTDAVGIRSLLIITH